MTLVRQGSVGFTAEIKQSHKQKSVARGVKQECPGKLTTHRHPEVEQE